MDTQVISKSYTNENMFCVFMLLLCITSNTFGYRYMIIFDERYSPPAYTPDVHSMYYSVPLNQTISKPIIAYLVYANRTRVTDGPYSNSVVNVSTIDAIHIYDQWQHTGGKICQHTAFNEDYPERADRSRAMTRCESNTVLTVRIIKGRIILDGIFHFHEQQTVPQHSRFIRISKHDLKIHVDTNPFLVTTPADHIKISKHPPTKVFANHAFQLSVSICDQSGNVVSTGLDSIAYVDLTIPYYYKTFYGTKEKKMMLKHSTIRLRANKLSQHESNQDFIIRMQANKGIVTFDSLRILDVANNLRLNITMTMARYPWLRIPTCRSCYDDVEHQILNESEITFPNLGPAFYKRIKSMILTDPIQIVPQVATVLRISDDTLKYWTKWTNKTSSTVDISRNIPIPGNFHVHIYDSSRERIFSGPDAEKKLVYTTVPPGVCISSDATDKIQKGDASIYISICQVIAKVKLIVSIENTNLRATTPHFRVGGVLNIAHLGDFSDSGHGLKIDSHIDSFIQIAIDLYNKGTIDKEFKDAGFQLKLTSFNTENKIHTAVHAFHNMTGTVDEPGKSFIAIISSESYELTTALTADIDALAIPYVSTSNSEISLVDGHRFTYISRVCWGQLRFLSTLVKINQERKWNVIIILREKKVTIHRDFRISMSNAQINIERELIFPEVDVNLKNSDILFQSEINQIKQWKSRIIYLFAGTEMQSYILHAAHLGGLDTNNGYQWVIIGQYVWRFPLQNSGICANCTMAFRGTIFISETYEANVESWDWIRALEHYFAADKYKIKGGIVRYRSFVVSVKMALGYDAVMLLIHGLNRIIAARKSIKGSTLNKMIRYGRFEGLTGNLTMSVNGARVGFLCFLAGIDPSKENLHYISLRRVDDIGEIEIPYEYNTTEGVQNAHFIDSNSSKLNRRRYLSRSGVISLASQRLKRKEGEQWPSERIFRYENVTPMFDCDHNCGFNPTDESDVTIYDSGRCNEDSTCSCKMGFSGWDCTTIDCVPLCSNGKCVSPDICQCEPGWSGKSCSDAICYFCNETYGFCDTPGKCKCFSNRLGRDCSIHLATVLVPLISGLLLIVIITFFSTKKFLDHKRQKSALNNLSWVVSWSTVECCVPEISFISHTSVSKRELSFLAVSTVDTYMWKNERWFVKPIPNYTISLDDAQVRFEMAKLTQIKHINVIKYGGACLTDPNVSLFMELTDKGSLNDVLHLASFDLGWEFRYSFMKDICSGMRYLHEETRIGSHGRLKSQNCLIDSHWSIKITGFGAPSIRYGKYRKPRKTHVEDLKNLLWTAPELLENANCLDDIQSGTKCGDIYSFSIIVSEILSWADPYEYELEYISERALLDLIMDPSSLENQSTRLKWKEIGGMNMLAIRPILREEHLAQTVLRRKMTRCILAEAWDPVPSGRPSFKKLLLMLEECYPTCGGLIDNLINLLSSYSNNLELIVLDRTREIEESKEKSEHLLRQLLPRNIAEELKQGRKIIPELYECVTMYFSNIVDFSEILMDSSPLQIVDFLNAMYNAFDSIVLRYKVHKVETICETYIVVSGMPERIGLQHAGEIATMSLDLLHLVSTYQIPHRPNTTLQLRIGIHSGPVVSGIVGTMMPRYCLFGDTVNTTSRMESSCIALRIHVSDTTAKILDDLGGYHLECRGIRQVKGRGLMCTWWLEGKDGFDKPLPDQSLALPLSRHHFK